MKNLKKKLVVISSLSIILVLLGIISGGNAYAEKVDKKTQKEIKQEKLVNIEEQIQELQEQEKTQEVWSQEGELLVEQAELEEELHPDEYYNQQIKTEIDTIEVAIADMKVAIDSDNLSDEKLAECQERVQKYGDILKEYKEAYESGKYTSLERLFIQEHEKICQLHSYFEKKYN